MKRIFVATLALATLFACNKDITNENSSIEDKVWVEFTAGIDTKASLVEGDKVTPHTITWEVDDLIAVNGETLKASEAGSKTTFTGEVGPAFLDAASYKAIYPRAAGTSFDAVTVEHEQDAVANGFDDIVAVAYSTTRSLNFKHVTSLIRFQVPSDFANITEVNFTADEALAGVVKVTHDSADGNPAVKVTTAENTVTLKGTFEAEKDYYVAVLPGAKTNLVVRINGYLSKRYPTATIPTSGVGNMGELPAPVASGYSICSSKTGWDFNNMTPMYNDIDGYFVAKNVDVEYFSIFHKAVTGWGDDRRYGPDGGEIAVSGLAKWNTTTNKNANAFLVSDPNKKYDVYFNLTNNKVYIADAGISLPDESNVFSLIGLGGEWNNLDVVCVKYDNTRYVARNIVIPSGGFKVRKNYSWDHSWGYGTITALDTKYTLNQKAENNIK